MPEDLDAEIDLSEIPDPAELPYVETDCAEDVVTAERARGEAIAEDDE